MITKSSVANDKLESRKQAAQRIGCSVRTLIRAERRGELTPIRLSSHMIRYRSADIERWIEQAHDVSNTQLWLSSTASSAA